MKLYPTEEIECIEAANYHAMFKDTWHEYCLAFDWILEERLMQRYSYGAYDPSGKLREP